MDQLRGQLRLSPPPTALPVSPSGGTGSAVDAPRWSRMRTTLLALFLVAACRPAPQSVRAAGDGKDAVTLSRIVDSILPLEEELRRFTAHSPPHLSLSNGAPSREGLVARWAAAIEARDSTALARLHVTAGEFIGLYYPHSLSAAPPYRQSPSLVWFRMLNTSSRGSVRVMRRHGGVPFHLRGVRCEEAPTPAGPVRIWSHCLVQRLADTTVREQRLFGPIIEHDGRFKFLTYDSEY